MQSKNFKFLMKVSQFVFQLSLGLNRVAEREPVLLRLRVTPLGFTQGAIVNETHINLENTTVSVLSVILFNQWYTSLEHIHGSNLSSSCCYNFTYIC